MLTKKQATKEDYEIVLSLWEKSVRATHLFLEEEDILFYKEMIPKHLDFVDLNLWYDDENIVGFTGVSDDELGMLFLDPDSIGQKYGSQILTRLIDQENIKKIDVNSQNKVAKEFYLKHGFTPVSEDKTDGFGKPYPITHLELI